MGTPPLLADFSHARACKPFCENSLTLPLLSDKNGEDILGVPLSIYKLYGGDMTNGQLPPHFLFVLYVLVNY